MSTNHNHTPSSTLELSAESRAMFDIQRLEEWRQAQHDRLNELTGDVNNVDYVRDFTSNIDSDLDDFLARNGVNTSDVGYSEIRSLYRDASIDLVKDTEWDNKPSSRSVRTGDDRSQKDVFLGRIDSSVGVMSDDDDESGHDPDEATREEEQRIERLAELKKAKHEAYVTQMSGRRYGEQARANREAYEEAEEAYAEALEDDIRRQLDEALVADISDEQRREIIEELANDYRRNDDQEQYALLMERGGVKARALAKYEKMSTIKKIGVGALLGAAGAGLGFVAGAVGAGAAVIGGGLAAYRLGRGYTMAKSGLYREPSADGREAFVYDTESGTDVSKQIVDSVNRQSRANLERADNIKKRAVLVGIGAAALGGGLSLAGGVTGAYLHSSQMPVPGTDIKVGLNDGHWRAGYIEHMPGVNAGELADEPIDITTDTGDTSTPDYLDPLNPPQLDTDTGTDTGAGGVDSYDPDSFLDPQDLPDDGVDHDAAPVGDDPVDVDALVDNLSEKATTIRPGEGWYETFGDHGIDSKYHAQLLNEVGPKIDAKYPDLAYFDKSAGEWRIGYSGELPRGASEIILQTAHDNGWLETSTVEVETSLELPVVPQGGGMNQLVSTHYDHVLTHEQSLGLGEFLESKPETAEFLYQSDYLQNTFGNPHGISEAGMISPEVHEAIKDYLDGLNETAPVDQTTTPDAASDTTTTGVSLEPEHYDSVTDSLNADNPPALVETPAEDTHPVEADPAEAPIEELDVFTRSAANPVIRDTIVSGEYSRLNTISLPANVHMDTLAGHLQGMTFSDGTPLIESAGTGSYTFNDRPDGARLPAGAVDAINAHLDALGLETYTLNTFNQSASVDLRKVA